MQAAVEMDVKRASRRGGKAIEVAGDWFER